MLTYAMTALAANKQARLAGAAGDVRPGRGRRPTAPTPCPSRVTAWLDARGATDAAPRRRCVGDDRAAGARSGPAATAPRWRVTAESVSRRGRLRRRPGRPDRRDREAATGRCIPTEAGHDAGILSAAGIPTAMLFVRNPTGVSHSPAEHAETADCLAGVDALADALERAGRGERVTTYWLRARPGCRRRGRGATVSRSRSRTAGSPRSTAGATAPPASADAARRPDAPRPRQLPQPRLPPGAARAHPAASGGTFWTWREQMYAVAARLDPGHLLRAGPGDVRARWRWPGSPRVGEFHYLHHRPGRHAVRRPQRDGRRRCVEAAARGRDPDHAARHLLPRRPASATAARGRRSVRFSDGDADALGRRGSAQLRRRRRRRRGRRRDPLGARRARATQLAAVAAAAAGPRRCTCTSPSRSPRTTPASRRTACTPTAAARRRTALLGPRTTAVHATHLTDDDIALLGGSRHPRLLLPDHRARPRRRHRPGRARCTTPAPAHARLATATRSSTCSRRCAAVELDERLATQRARALVAPPSCSTPPPPTGHAQPRLRRRRRGSRSGARADLVTLDTDTPAHRRHRRRRAHGGLRGHRRRRRPRWWSTAGSSSPAATTAATSAASSTPRSTALGGRVTQHAGHRHRRAGHQRPARPTDLLGVVDDAALVVEGGRVAWVGPRRRRAGRRRRASTSAAARCIPGFVDSHTHLVFAGDRAAEFAARMAGERRTPPAASAPPSPPPAPPPTSSCAAHVARLVAEMRAPGHHDRRDQERLRADRRTTRPAASRSPGSSPTRRRSSARTSCPPSTPTTRRRTSTWSPARCWRPARRTPAGSTCSASAAPSTATRPARSSPPARRTGLRGRLHANQLGPGPGRAARRASSALAARRPLHLPRPTPTSTRSPTRGTVATLLPGVEFSTRSPYPDARRLLDAGVTVALATDCNPGSCYTVSMPLCIALAVREMGMTPAEARARRDAGGRARRSTATTSARLVAGAPGRPGGARRAAATCTWPTAPASRWSRGVWVAGRPSVDTRRPVAPGARQGCRSLRSPGTADPLRHPEHPPPR